MCSADCQYFCLLCLRGSCNIICPLFLFNHWVTFNNKETVNRNCTCILVSCVLLWFDLCGWFSVWYQEARHPSTWFLQPLSEKVNNSSTESSDTVLKLTESSMVTESTRICVTSSSTLFWSTGPPRRELVSWCFEPSQPQKKTKKIRAKRKLLSISKSFISRVIIPQVMFLSLFILRGHSTREPASGRMTNFILRAYTGTMC